MSEFRRLAAMESVSSMPQLRGLLDDVACAGQPGWMLLASGLEDEDFEVRAYAAKTLGELRVARSDVVIALARALEDEQPKVRRAAAKALAKVTPHPLPVFDALIRAQHDADPVVREYAAEAVDTIAVEPLPGRPMVVY